MEGKIVLGSRRWWIVVGHAYAFNNITTKQNLRLEVTKPSYGAAVHGTRLAVTKTINKEEVDMEICKEKDKKNNKRHEVEKKVDSQIKHSESEDSDDAPVN